MSPAIQLLQSSIGKANQMLNHGGSRLSATDRLVLDASRRSFVKAASILKKHEENTPEAEDTLESLQAEAQILFARIDRLQALAHPEAAHDPQLTQDKVEALFPQADEAKPGVSEAAGVAEALPAGEEGLHGDESTLQAVWGDGQTGELSPSERPE